MISIRRVVTENLIKTGLMLGVVVLVHFWVADRMLQLSPGQQTNTLTVLGLLLAGCVAGTFAFSYEKLNMQSNLDRGLGHAVSFLLNLGIGLLLDMTLWTIASPAGAFLDPIFMVGLLVYGAVILYDFWDLLRWYQSKQ